MLIVYSVICFSLLFLISKSSYKLNLVDIPNKRKKHSIPVAYTGGISISVIYICSIQFFDIHHQSLNIILSIAFLISAVGLIDDKYNLNIGGKLSLQVFPIIYLIIVENLNLRSIGNYQYFILELGSFAIPFTLISVLLLINAFNYFDGLDGVLGFVSLSTLLILYFLISDEHIKLYLLLIIIPILIFLLFNFSIFNLPKTFLGDSGSLLIGFIVAFTLIFLANEKVLDPILLAWTITVFVYEFLSINLLRALNNKNIFEPRMDHLHHLIFKKTKSIILTNFLITGLNILFFLIGYLSFYLIGSLASLFLYIFLFIIFFKVRKNYYKN